MKIWVITYKEKFSRNKEEYQIYDICISEKVAKNRLKEIEGEERSDKTFNIEEWTVREQ